MFISASDPSIPVVGGEGREGGGQPGERGALCYCVGWRQPAVLQDETVLIHFVHTVQYVKPPAHSLFHTPPPTQAIPLILFWTTQVSKCSTESPTISISLPLLLTLTLTLTPLLLLLFDFVWNINIGKASAKSKHSHWIMARKAVGGGGRGGNGVDWVGSY